MSFVVPVGIDLGTTNSAAAFVSAAGQTELVPNEFSDLLTPSEREAAFDWLTRQSVDS